jgi:hypothetical protein
MAKSHTFSYGDQGKNIVSREHSSAARVVFLGLDVGNGNHIGVLVIILCHNSP